MRSKKQRWNLGLALTTAMGTATAALAADGVSSFQTFESGFAYGALHGQNGWQANASTMIDTGDAALLEYSIEVLPDAADPNGRGAAFSPLYFGSGPCPGKIEMDVLLNVDDGAQRFITPAVNGVAAVTRLSFDAGGTVSVLQGDPNNPGAFVFLPTTALWSPGAVHHVEIMMTDVQWHVGVIKQTMLVVFDGVGVWSGENIAVSVGSQGGFDFLAIENFGVAGNPGVGDAIIVDNIRVTTFKQLQLGIGWIGGGANGGNGPGAAGNGAGPGDPAGGGGAGAGAGVGPGGDGLVLNNWDTWIVSRSRHYPAIVQEFDLDADGESEGLLRAYVSVDGSQSTVEFDPSGYMAYAVVPGQVTAVAPVLLTDDGRIDFFAITEDDRVFKGETVQDGSNPVAYTWVVTELLNPDLGTRTIQSVDAQDVDADGVFDCVITARNAMFEEFVIAMRCTDGASIWTFNIGSDYAFNSFAVGEFSGGPEGDIAYANLSEQVICVQDVGAPGQAFLPAFSSPRIPNALGIGDADGDGRDNVLLSGTDVTGSFPNFTFVNIWAWLGGSQRDGSKTANDLGFDDFFTTFFPVDILDLALSGQFEARRPTVLRGCNFISASVLNNVSAILHTPVGNLVGISILAAFPRATEQAIGFGTRIPVGAVREIFIAIEDRLRQEIIMQRVHEDLPVRVAGATARGPAWLDVSSSGPFSALPGRGVVTDVNRDGRPDIVYVRGAGDIEIVLNDGMGWRNGDIRQLPIVTQILGIPVGIGGLPRDMELRSVPAARSATSPESLYVLYPGDFTIPEPAGVGVWEHNGVDGYMPGVAHVDPNFDSARDLEIADVNEDGFDDLIVSGFSGVHIALGQPGGGWASSTQVQSAQGAHLEVVDIDDDDNLDIVLGYDSLLVYLLGDGTGGFGPQNFITPPSEPFDFSQVTGLLVDDLDKDGFPEIVISRGAYLHVNRGDGRSPVPAFGWHSMRLSDRGLKNIINAGDLSGDGICDLIVGEFQGASFIPVLYKPHIGYPVLSRPLGVAGFGTGGLEDMALADMDGDGAKEFIGVGTNDGTGAPARIVVVYGRTPDDTPCPRDLNEDGFVQGEDLAAVLAAWGTSNPTVDFNGDGVVDGMDLAAVLASWGPCP